MLKRTRDLEEIKRRKMARSRFRKIIRIVSLNRIWLVDADDQKFSLNVKKNIAMIVRPQRKLGLLTMAVSIKISVWQYDGQSIHNVLYVGKIFNTNSSYFAHY